MGRIRPALLVTGAALLALGCLLPAVVLAEPAGNIVPAGLSVADCALGTTVDLQVDDTYVLLLRPGTWAARGRCFELYQEETAPAHPGHASLCAEYRRCRPSILEEDRYSRSRCQSEATGVPYPRFPAFPGRIRSPTSRRLCCTSAV